MRGETGCQRIPVEPVAAPVGHFARARGWLLPPALVLLAVLGPVSVHLVGAMGHGLLLILPFLLLQAAVMLALRLSPWLQLWPFLTGGALLAAPLWGQDPAGTLLVIAGMSHAAIYLSLGCAFAAGLRRGRTDLVTRLASRVDPHWFPAMARYTRRVAIAWTLFFFAQPLLSLLLALVAGREAWSVFVNLLDLPLLLAMFVAEYLVRRRAFPDHPHVGIGTAIRAVRQGSIW